MCEEIRLSIHPAAVRKVYALTPRRLRARAFVDEIRSRVAAAGSAFCVFRVEIRVFNCPSGVRSLSVTKRDRRNDETPSYRIFCAAAGRESSSFFDGFPAAAVTARAYRS